MSGLERWEGYDEQNWQQRFARLDADTRMRQVQFMALCDAKDARITALEAENERMREREKRNLSDTSRLIWRDEVEGICPSLDMCFEYGDHVRCGPCAVKASLAQGVEPNLALPALPEVSRLKRENERMKAALEIELRDAEDDARWANDNDLESCIARRERIAQALGGHHDAD